MRKSNVKSTYAATSLLKEDVLIFICHYCGLIVSCQSSGYSYSGLGITEYMEFQFRKELSYMF